MSTSTTSTPLTLFNTSAFPTILSQEMTETSFYSAVPTPTIPELPQNNKKCLSKVYHSIILMGILIGVLLLVLIKVLQFSLYMLSCFKGCCQFSKDLNDFLKQRREIRHQEIRQQDYQEAPYPLVNYQQR